MSVGRRRRGRPRHVTCRKRAVERAKLMLLQLGLLLRVWSMGSALDRNGGRRYCRGCTPTRLPPG